jgi:hypothetical protein
MKTSLSTRNSIFGEHNSRLKLNYLQKILEGHSALFTIAHVFVQALHYLCEMYSMEQIFETRRRSHGFFLKCG